MIRLLSRSHGFSLPAADSIRVRRLGFLSDLFQPIAALLFAGRIFPLHWPSFKRNSLLYADWHIFWLLNSHQCQPAMSYWSFVGLRGYQNVAEDLDEIWNGFGTNHDGTFLFFSHDCIGCSLLNASFFLLLTAYLLNALNVLHLVVGSGIRRHQSSISHCRWSLLFCHFKLQGGLFWWHFIFTWLGTSQDRQLLGYISGTAFAASLTALLDGEIFELGHEKQRRYR